LPCGTCIRYSAPADPLWVQGLPLAAVIPNPCRAVLPQDDVVPPTEGACRARRHVNVIGSTRALALARVCMMGVILLAAQRGAAISLSGFAVPSAITTGGGVLQAASCGVRSTLWIEHYVAVLYLRPDVGLEGVRNPSEPKAVLMYVVEGRYLPDEIPAKWRDALDSALDERSLRAVRQSFRRLASGDLINITYMPGDGISMHVNRRLIARGSGHRAVDAIIEAWASETPLLEKLERLAQEHPC
jgi:hypothetical protein